jgi:hypothetical protein
VANPITPPSNLNTCANKVKVLGYLEVNLTTNIANNQLVSYSTIEKSFVNEFEISLDRQRFGNTTFKRYTFLRSDGSFMSTPDFGNIVIVGTVRFEEIGSVSDPYTGQCTVLRTQDVSFRYELSHPYNEDVIDYVESINPYSITGFEGGCSDPANRIGMIKVDFNSFTNSPVTSGNNKLTINPKIRDR